MKQLQNALLLQLCCPYVVTNTKKDERMNTNTVENKQHNVDPKDRHDRQPRTVAYIVWQTVVECYTSHRTL